jgi:putative nucleotidyltransferase with HDIG domain
MPPRALPKQLPSNLKIPTLPSVVQRLNQMIEDPEAGTREIGAVIAGDAPLAAEVLRIANSAYYGLREPCASPEQASSVLGARVLRNVVLQASVIRHFEHLADTGFDLQGLWKHAILCAQACSFLARRCRSVKALTPDELYSCGLLHDLGQMVMLEGLGAPYAELVLRARAEGTPQQVAERKAFNYDHTVIGALVAEAWGLPEAVCGAIRFHHGPREAVRDNAVVSLVAHANLLVHRVADGDLEAAGTVIDVHTAGFLGLGLEDVAETVRYLVERSATIEV